MLPMWLVITATRRLLLMATLPSKASVIRTGPRVLTSKVRSQWSYRIPPSAGRL